MDTTPPNDVPSPLMRQFQEMAQRMQRLGLIMDRQVLTSRHRKAVWAWERTISIPEAKDTPKPEMGFAYPH